MFQGEESGYPLVCDIHWMAMPKRIHSTVHGLWRPFQVWAFKNTVALRKAYTSLGILPEIHNLSLSNHEKTPGKPKLTDIYQTVGVSSSKMLR